MINLQNNQGKTPLHYACHEGHEQIAQLLLMEGATIERSVDSNFLTGRRHDGDRRFIKWTRFLVKASWLNIRRKCCKACGTGTQERYCLI